MRLQGHGARGGPGSVSAVTAASGRARPNGTVRAVGSAPSSGRGESWRAPVQASASVIARSRNGASTPLPTVAVLRSDLLAQPLRRALGGPGGGAVAAGLRRQRVHGVLAGPP